MFSYVFYTEDTIIIHNFYGKVVYPKEQFLDIRPVGSLIPIYHICFRDGRKFLFGENVRYLNLDDSRKKVIEMKKKLLAR